FMSRSIESWFNVRVDSALEAGLNLGRAALDTQLSDVRSRAKIIATGLNDTSDADMAVAITRLRETNGVAEAMIFTGSGRLVAFSSSDNGQLIPDGPPAHVLNHLRVARSYEAAEADEPPGVEDGQAADVSGGEQGLHLRVVIPIRSLDRA